MELIDHQRSYQLYKVDSVQVRIIEEDDARIGKCAIRHCSSEPLAFACTGRSDDHAGRVLLTVCVYSVLVKQRGERGEF